MEDTTTQAASDGGNRWQKFLDGALDVGLSYAKSALNKNRPTETGVVPDAGAVKSPGLLAQIQSNPLLMWSLIGGGVLVALLVGKKLLK